MNSICYHLWMIMLIIITFLQWIVWWLVIMLIVCIHACMQAFMAINMGERMKTYKHWWWQWQWWILEYIIEVVVKKQSEHCAYLLVTNSIVRIHACMLAVVHIHLRDEHRWWQGWVLEYVNKKIWSPMNMNIVLIWSWQIWSEQFHPTYQLL